MSDLPKGWTLSVLGKIASWGSGGTPSRNNPSYYGGGIPWIKTGELGQRIIITTDETISQEGLNNSSAKLFPAGSVVIAMYGATIGKTSILGIEATTNQACAVGIPNKDLTSKEYLYYYLCSQKNSFVEAGKGGAQPNISQSIIKEWSVPLAPLNEQKRIADKLDTLLVRVDACRERLDRIPAILKRFRQAVLVAATSGKLTEDWQKINSDKVKWESVKFTDVGELNRGKSKHRPRNDSRLYGGPYPFIQTGDIAQSGGIIITHSQTYSEFGLAQSKLWPSGTVCITIAANIADTAILTYPACFPDSVVGFINNPEKCLPEFIKWSIDVMSKKIKSFAPATAQKNINLAILNDLEFPCPSIDEQKEIVRRVEALFAYADRLEARYTTARTQVEKLTPALLAKAFRGELVPQNPSDEPASVLLERIRSSRAESKIKPKPRHNHSSPC
ncbi:restriction endonuclease subunit S [Nitrosomonas sp. Nm34]|uniref:restriction endonuclease subunit S n=1 Tax=Nitrosomonas sp. Nm34 TaxID=1881055 RepID=UPI0008EE5D43|nr:restriction endonuclease subunit S [Nitrosomonas sp. Nm34]SFI30315.1 type I restriction enzyme, S subunit [Nitrosomonas sp. Nm34]